MRFRALCTRLLSCCSIEVFRTLLWNISHAQCRHTNQGAVIRTLELGTRDARPLAWSCGTAWDEGILTVASRVVPAGGWWWALVGRFRQQGVAVLHEGRPLVAPRHTVHDARIQELKQNHRISENMLSEENLLFKSCPHSKITAPYDSAAGFYRIM